MAYCVHCGVRLENSESHCPLCLTPVLDPSEPDRRVTEKKYPPRTPDQELKRSRRFLISLALLLLLLPALICLLCDLLTGGGFGWSLYPVSALTLLFISVSVPVLTRPGLRIPVACGTGFVTLNAYLWLIELFSASGPWFFPIVFPSLLTAFLLSTSTVFLKLRDKLNKLTLIAALFADVALECFLTEVFTSLHGSGSVHVNWSLFVLIPCLFISLSLFLINSNRPLREEFRRRTHI